MEKLRINRKLYVNQGTKDKTKRGEREHHVTFKFSSEKDAKKFIEDVKNWYYSK